MVAPAHPPRVSSCQCGWKGPPTLDAAKAHVCKRRTPQVAPLSAGVTLATRREPRWGAKTCVLGHSHDSKGEATACPRVYTEAAHEGLTVFRPGRPGVPCFKLAPHGDTGRPVYVSVDWLLCDQHGKPVKAVDYKGSVAKSKRFDKGWARGKRILETELGIRVEELT